VFVVQRHFQLTRLHIAAVALGDDFAGVADDVAHARFVAVKMLVAVFVAKKYQIHAIVVKVRGEGFVAVQAASLALVLKGRGMRFGSCSSSRQRFPGLNFPIFPMQGRMPVQGT